MSRRAALLALLGLVALAGCLGGTASGPSAEAMALKNDTMAAMADVDRYGMEMTMEMGLEDRNLTMDLVGAINRTGQRARMTINLTGPTSVSMLMIIDGQTAYMKVNDRWQQRNVPQNNLWEQNNRLERQRAVFEASTFEITGHDVIAGTPVTVVEIEVPDSALRTLTSIAQSSAGITAGKITDAEYTAYIANDSKLLRRSIADLTMQIQDRTIEATIDMRFSDFGVDPNITIPEGATETSAVLAAPS